MKGLFVHQVCKGEQLVAELELQRLCRTAANLWQAVFCAIRQEFRIRHVPSLSASSLTERALPVGMKICDKNG